MPHIHENIFTPVHYLWTEIQKFLGTMFLQWDEELTGPGEDEAPKVNTSDLNEELGQVRSALIANQ